MRLDLVHGVMTMVHSTDHGFLPVLKEAIGGRRDLEGFLIGLFCLSTDLKNKLIQVPSKALKLGKIIFS